MRWLWPVVQFALYAIISPTYERGSEQPRVTLVSTFLAIFITFFAVEFVGLLSLYMILGARPTEIREQLEMLSEPLRWFSPQFLITPDRSFLDTLGIMLGNSFVISLPVFVCVKVVRSMFRRNRVTQMGLDGSIEQEDD